MPLPIPAPHASGQTTTTALPLYWAAYGAPGAPRALVLHGGPGADHQYLLPQMLALGEGPAARELLFYDQRGGGRSKADDRAPITWRTHAEDVAAVVHELMPADEPLTIVGYSWGGLLALLYTIEAAADTNRPSGPSAAGTRRAPDTLVLLDPAPVTSDYRREFEAEFARRQRSPAVQALRDELVASGLRERDPDAYRERAFELSVAGYFADPANAHDLTPFRVVGRVQQSVWESLGDARGDFDLRPDLERAFAALPSLRTLVVHGRQDPIPLASSTDVARAAGAELVVIEGCGHVPYVEGSAALFPAIAGFLTQA